ncbi:MAG: 4Fe-4S cluster-binding domain-containing protein [Methanomassiliicoccus sp.]|nr:4Fe-4S cluster-binding domain-containing protein [Methanomassiliicoccus sp.]
MKVQSMEAGSAYTGRLPRGCVLCRQGTKMVLLVSGQCTTGCFYCPLSLEKRGKDVIYANERRVASDDEILEEARSIGAQGTGVTGGDPVACLERTVHLIKMLKQEFGPRHHIHLYTSSLDLNAFRRLEEAGLDELRLHPPAEMWSSMAGTGLAAFKRSSGMKVGLEVPALPGEEKGLSALIAYAAEARLDFVNLNELEFSEGNWDRLMDRGMEVKDEVSAAVKGSEEAALKAVAAARKVPVHYCSSSFKDSVQLRKRIKRRAVRVALPSDVITEEGTLLKGVVEGSMDGIIALLRQYEVPEELFRKDEEKKRVEVAPWVLEELFPELPYESFLVEEYPTADRLEVEREPLKPR